MNFDPEKIVKNVLEHYLTTSYLGNPQDVLTFTTPSPGLLNGNPQHYEQVNLFLFGHLLPDYQPLKVRFRLDKSTVLTGFDLPKASQHAYHNLFESLSQNSELDKLNQTIGARLRCSIDPPTVVLDFPIQRSNQQENSNTYFDLDDIKARYPQVKDVVPLFEGFFHNARRHLDLLEHAYSEGDWKEVHRHAHALKGGAMNLSANRLSTICANFEAAVKARSITTIEAFTNTVKDELLLLEADYLARKELFFV